MKTNKRKGTCLKYLHILSVGVKTCRYQKRKQILGTILSPYLSVMKFADHNVWSWIKKYWIAGFNILNKM